MSAIRRNVGLPQKQVKLQESLSVHSALEEFKAKITHSLAYQRIFVVVYQPLPSEFLCVI